MALFFSSDLHLGHAALVKRGYRPFSSVEEMDETIIAKWNTRVRPTDQVWLLGDFTLKGAETATAYLARLNGEIDFIPGNHDRGSVRHLPRWKSVAYGAEIRSQGHQITLCHYAHVVWKNSHRGSIMLHGHSHGSLPANSQRLDVAVDCWDWAPVTLDEILVRLATLPLYRYPDHHQPRTPD